MQRLELQRTGSRLFHYLVMALTVGLILVALAMAASSGLI